MKFRQIKTAGFTGTLSFRPEKSRCGDIDDAVSFQIDDTGPWCVHIDDLRGMLRDAEKARGLPVEPDTDATDEQRYQFLEARSQRDAAEADRLAKKLTAEGRGLPVVCGDDREKMREVIEAMRPIVDAIVAYMDIPKDAGGGREWRRVLAAVSDNRDRLAAAMSAWADSQTWSEAEKLREEFAAMEKVVEAACAWSDFPTAIGDQSDVVGPLERAVNAYRKQGQR
jgi:hypothetical protein